jgi:uncharacterized protein YbjT (DUF2867 family)
MKVLTIGATGRNAGLVVPELKRRGVTVRALVRDDRRGELAQSRGADEVVLGDLADPPTLQAAVDGVDGVFHINPAFAPQQAQMGVGIVEAAKAAGVHKFVFSSIYHPSVVTMPNHAAKLPVEEAIYDSGMDFTILQPAMFMQNLERGWPAVLRSSRLTIPYPKRVKICYVDYRDVAEAAALAITTDTLSYGTFELSAPGTLDGIELAAIISRELGRSIEADEISPQQWASRVDLPDGPRLEGMLGMYTRYNELRGGYAPLGGNALVLRAILGREPRTVEQYIHELASGP